MGKQNKWEYKVEKEGFSDKEKEKGGGSLRQVYYNVYDYGRLIGSHTTGDIQTMLHCSRQVPEHCAAEEDIHLSGWEITVTLRPEIWRLNGTR